MENALSSQNLGFMPYLVAGSQILGIAILAITGAWLAQYRGGFSWSGPLQFNVHPLCMVLGMVFLCGEGIIAVFQYHQANGYPDMYSLHSWCGIVTFTLYILQWIIGFSLFFIPGVAFTYRSQFKPLHEFFGRALFLSSIATSLLGLTEKMFSEYSSHPAEGILVNSLGVLLVVFGAVIAYILTREDWRRPPLPEEQALSMDFKTLTEGDSPTDQ
ncbi:transmembrane ascorbate-dependent reductase CYB561 isoform X2 [Xenopus laevis]|uniref:Transmembrane ascorbate-dependent reductase CYB561 n=2 Tax=Xenopus laevis TaxID=8355 RepID=Q6NRZ7_XENLA|nr:transmembrane ascorbate-dependent reductase CYB561 isoform X2 [Xenopus laevis]AAH70556.1 Cyb561 protein [Xenopus laevis]OCT62269.1 hypothetical protein XELAEV_18043353mg [Xenopus laevis]